MIELTNAVYNKHSNQYMIEGHYGGRINSKNCSVFLELRNTVKDDFDFPVRYYPDVAWGDDIFKLQIDMDCLIHKFADHQIWDLCFLYKNKVKRINSENKISLISENYRPIKHHLMAKMYMTKFHSIGLAVKKEQAKFAVKAIKLFNDHIHISFSVDQSYDNEKLSLTVKNRIQPDIIYYHFTIQYPFKEKAIASVDIPLQDFCNDRCILKHGIWDFFIQTDSNLEYYLTVSKSYRSTTINNTTFNYFVYGNFRNQLSINIKASPDNFVLIDTRFTEHNINLWLKKGTEILSLNDLFLINKKHYDNGLLESKRYRINYVQGTDQLIIVKIPFKYMMSQAHVNHMEFILYYEASDTSGHHLISPVAYSDEGMHLNEAKQLKRDRLSYSFSLIGSIQNHEIHLLIDKKRILPDEKAVRLAVCGSCFSRLAFSSSDFYNPDYKNKYNVVYTQYHSSIISLMSQPSQFPDELFRGYNKREVEYLKSDFSKDFFAQLKKAKPDFLILDFYVDGSKDVIFFDKDHAISVNYMLRKNKEYLYKIRRSSKLTHVDIQLYLKIWEESIRAFAEKIVKIIPQDRIILHRIKKAADYLDSQGHLHKFKEYERHIKRSNYLFEYMEDYFINVLPHVQIIDSTEKEYHSVYNHPESVTPDHLESQFYRNYLSSLDHLVITHWVAHKKNTRPLDRTSGLSSNLLKSVSRMIRDLCKSVKNRVKQISAFFYRQR
ncbi:DUF6270 domain-containing protein [Sporolactobacillus sp. THM19-2]|uniref:DUF6270 domain-containing protein n=1 Tax=Sporolactobacillus sp. THM19-2 TaxID=2511171 RepID=UPI001022148F|nr:DUF6270 domain-containing protein [Sporolactobacillus sp. THM19-2]RYL90299.1 hypothetical protein EWH91_10095 [Sporolactobacillus sp. THM19-2]